MEKELSQLLGLSESVVSEVLEKIGYSNDNGAAASTATRQFLEQVRQRLQQTPDDDEDEDAEKLRAQLQYDNTCLEQEVHRLNKQAGQLRSSLDNASNVASAKEQELADVCDKLAAASKDLETQRTQVSALATKEAQLREQVGQFQSEKRGLLAQIAERREQLDDKAAEVHRLNEIILDLRQQRSTDQDELARLRSQHSVSDVSEHMLKQSLDLAKNQVKSQHSVSDVSEHMLKQSLDLAKNQVKWLDDELTATQDQMHQAKTDLARTTAVNKAEISRLRTEIEALTEQSTELRERNSQLERTLRAKLESERTIKEELAENTELFKREMFAQKKLCSEWEKTADAAKQHVRSVEESLQELEAHQRETEARAQEAVSMMEQRVSELEQAYAEAQERIASLENDLSTANGLLAESARPQSMLLSPTASVASKLQGSQGRLNITQLYTEKNALEDKLKEAETEIACLRESMEQILSEIEERGPIIAAEREEYQRLLSDADRIAQDLASVRQESLSKDKDLKQSRKECELLQRQLASEQQQTRDLGRQVAKLLRSTEEMRMGGRQMPDSADDAVSVASSNPLASPIARRTANRSAGVCAAPAPTPGATPEQDEQWLNEVDRVISQKLVTFADINEMVAQNRRLLRTTRELAAQVAQEEERQLAENESEIKDALEQAEDMLSRLSHELETTRNSLGIVERERDMLKTLRSSHPRDAAKSNDGDDGDIQIPPVASESSYVAHYRVPGSRQPAAAENPEMQLNKDHEESAIAQLQSDFDTYRVESLKTRRQLEEDAAKLQNEVSELRVRAAKAEAQNQFDAERIQMFNRDLEGRQKEVDHLRVATSRLHSQAESYEKQLESISQELSTERVELGKLRRQAASLEAERDILRQSEQRWRNEEQRLLAERASMTQILQNTTKMRDEWQKASEEQVEQVRERLENTRKESDRLHQEIRQAREANDRAQFKFDSELNELRSQIQQREAKISQLQSQITEGRETQNKIQSEKHEVVLARDALQRQVAALEARIQNQDALVQRVKAQGQSVSKESLLAVQLQDARSQLESFKSELETTSKRAEDFRQLSTANEASLKELADTYDQYKAQQEKAGEEQRQKIAALEKDLDEAKTSLQECRDELAAANKDSQDVKSVLAEKQSEYQARISQLEGDIEQKSRSLSSLREDAQRQSDSLQSLQEQYEREIVAHAKDIEGTLLARERLRDSQKNLAEVTSELQASEQASERLRSEVALVKQSADDDVKLAESQLGEIKRQNALLLAHLESIGHQRQQIRVSAEIADAEAGGGAKQGGLREVVAYLRRERDLVTAQLELAQQESQRWRQQANHTQRALDEVRNELLQYAPASEVGAGASEQSVGAARKAGANAATSATDVIPAGDGPITLTASQRQTCRQQIEQATLLRESNTVLRSELASSRSRLHELEDELCKIKDREVPQLRNSNATLQAELEATHAQVSQLQSMCEHWKQRHEKVLARYQMVEPEDFESLKKENEQLKEQVSKAAKAQHALSTEASKVKLLQSEISRLKAQLESQIASLSSEQQRRQAELRSKLQISRANKKASDLEKQVEELESKIRALESPAAQDNGDGASELAKEAEPADESASLKRPHDGVEGPVKKAHVDE
ncbi:Filament-forming protein [Dipsacomyces acuminosporus]|nr:Filament-forming protein [Dipsacomyces acuminosporus]